MIQFASSPSRVFECGPPQSTASPESRKILETWINTRHFLKATASSNRFVSAEGHPFTATAFAELAGLSPSVLKQAKTILERLAEIVPTAGWSDDQPLHIAKLDDGSVVLEWLKRDRRLGFSLEQNQGESGWFYVYSAGSSMRSEAGSMDQLDLKRMTSMMSM